MAHFFCPLVWLAVTCGEFIDDFEEYEKAYNIKLTGIEDFTSKYVPEKNKIILKKQGDDTKYDLDLKYFHFKQIDLNNAKKHPLSLATDKISDFLYGAPIYIIHFKEEMILNNI